MSMTTTAIFKDLPTTTGRTQTVVYGPAKEIQVGAWLCVEGKSVKVVKILGVKDGMVAASFETSKPRGSNPPKRRTSGWGSDEQDNEGYWMARYPR